VYRTLRVERNYQHDLDAGPLGFQFLRPRQSLTNPFRTLSLCFGVIGKTLSLIFHGNSVKKILSESSITIMSRQDCFFLPPSIIAMYPRTFSNRFWRSLLTACRKYIQWYVFYLRSVTLIVFGSSFTRFGGHKQRRTTVGRTPLDKWPVRRRDL